MLSTNDIIRCHDLPEAQELLDVLDQEHYQAIILPHYNNEAGYFIKITGTNEQT